MVMDLLTDSAMMVSSIYSRADWSWGLALAKRVTSSLATSSDLLLRCR